jgi:D-glycero-D-manno-heptose 1,7-bisphosphate phosphatase
VPVTRPAVFLDRDGTINVDSGYVWRARDLELCPGAAEGIARLNDAGHLVIVVTNQSGVARGYFSEDDVTAFHRVLSDTLNAHGAHVDAFYYAPFHPSEGKGRYRCESRLRKPDIGMFELAMHDFAIDVERSWMVGDHLHDMEFARRAGLRAILVGSVPRHPSEGEPPFAWARDLASATGRILGR